MTELQKSRLGTALFIGAFAFTTAALNTKRGRPLAQALLNAYVSYREMVHAQHKAPVETIDAEYEEISSLPLLSAKTGT